MKGKKYSILTWAAAFLPLLLVAVFWTRLPEQVPVRWNFNGNVEYSGRGTFLLVAGLTPLLLLLLTATPKIDPKKKNYQKFTEAYRTFCLFIALFMDIIMGILLVEAFRPGSLNVGMIVQLLVALLLLFVGNMMPKFRQNYFCGIKNPWTLSSERVWTQTHRLGGRLYFAAGLVNLVGAFLPQFWGYVLLLASAFGAVLVTTIMSYLWYRQEQQAISE